MRSSRRAGVLLVLVGAALALVAQTQTWARGSLSSGVSAFTELTVSGGTASPGVGALALVAAAGAIVLVTSGRSVRLVGAALVLLAGVAVAVLALTVGWSARDTLRPVAETSTGTTIDVARISAVQVTPWPFVAALGGAAMVAGAAWCVLRGRDWAAPSARYERPLGRTAATDPPRIWDALTRGDDPTT